MCEVKVNGAEIRFELEALPLEYVSSQLRGNAPFGGVFYSFGLKPTLSVAIAATEGGHLLYSPAIAAKDKLRRLSDGCRPRPASL